MADPTRPRGSSDTPAEAGRAAPSPARAARAPHRQAVAGLLVRAASSRALRVALAAAFFLHLPFIPNPLVDWISVLLSVGDGEITDYDAGETIIPLDLDLLASDPVAASQSPTGESAPGAPSAPPPAATPAPAPPPAPPSAPTASAGAPDAGADAARPPDRDAGAGDAGKPPEPENGAPKLRDPLAAAGAPGKLASKDPNVQVLIAGDRLRKHDLGPWFGRILTTIPEWQSFFKDTPIDPIRDLDHMLIAGPQFRDSSKVVAVMDYRIPEEDVRAAVDVLVQRTGGEWLPDAPVPAARAKADRATRIFALVPQKRLLVVLPIDQEDELEKLKGLKSFNRSSAAGIVISMLTPANAFKNVYKLPKSLKWMRLTVTPTQDGGADLALTAGDGSPEEAKEHAVELTRAINAVRSIDLGITSVEVLDEVKLEADGAVLWTKVHVKSKQLKLIMGFVEEGLKAQAEARNKKKE